MPPSSTSRDADPARRPEERPSVGRSIPRLDGADKVTGRALYVDDVPLPAGALHGKTVRSAVPHGVLTRVELDPAFDWSGVVVVTADDVPGKNVIALIEDDQPALVPLGGVVKHVDEAIALVAAPTLERAIEARAHVKPVIRPLPALFDARVATHADVRLHGEDNVMKRFEIVDGGDVDEALAAAHLVVDGVYDTGAQEQMYIEPQGMIATFGEDLATCRVLGSLQCPYYVHKALVKLLDLPEAAVTVAQTTTGGGFGGKEEYPSMLAAHAALLARKARATVKMVYDRTEDIAATTKRHPAVIRHRLGVDETGRLLAVDVDVLLDGGAYVTLSPVVLSRAILHAAGPYRCPNVRVRGRVVATNHPPHGAFRGFGAPQVTFAYERQMERAARALGLDPFELRRRNAYVSGDRTATGQVLRDSVGSAAVLDAVEAQLARPGPPRAPRVGDMRHLARGRGLAFCLHGAGFTGSGEARLRARAEVRFVPGDDVFEVLAGSTDIGQGTTTIFAQITSAALDVPLAAVRIANPDTAHVPDSGPTVASRTCMVVGSVLERASTALRARIESLASAHGLEGALLDRAASLGARGVVLSEMATYDPPGDVRWDDATYRGDAYPVFGWAACAVDVAVDLDTLEVEVERCIHAIDVGKAIHPTLVAGQIEGGTVQALGWALLENVVYREGRVANANMTDCLVPTSFDVPELETLIIEVPYRFGPSGAKGVGEIPMDGPAAAVANAVEAALGVACDGIPLVPERLAVAVAIDLDSNRPVGATGVGRKAHGATGSVRPEGGAR